MADAEIYCPRCSRLMVKRKARKPPFKAFYGCPAYFPKSDRAPNGFDAEEGEKQCTGAIFGGFGKKEEIVKVPLPNIKGSKQQLAIWREMEHGTSHICVNALAGTGKTSTIVVGASKLTGSVLAIAFNNKIAKELTARMPDKVKTCTFHSLGWQAIRAVYGKNLDLNKYKSHNIVERLLGNAEMEENEKNSIKFNTAKLVSLCKNRLVDPSRENLDELCLRYKVDCNGEQEKIYELVPLVLSAAAKSKTEFDFDDQIWIPLVQNLPLGTYDNVLVDEAQDLNPARIEMIFKVMGNNGRMIIVGDKNQAIYGFTGCSTESMEVLEARLSA